MAEPSVKYLFTSYGGWIGYLYGRAFFSVNNEWSGWVPEMDVDRVYTLDGEYIGTIYGDRLLYEEDLKFSRSQDEPMLGRWPDPPEYPGYIKPVDLPAGTRDIHELAID
jgi:hypothetical protein